MKAAKAEALLSRRQLLTAGGLVCQHWFPTSLDLRTSLRQFGTGQLINERSEGVSLGVAERQILELDVALA